MSTDYDGAHLLDSAGEQVGRIERTYLDGNGEALFVEVRTGKLLPHHHLVPAEQAEMLPEGLRVPYTLAEIEESPAAKYGETLEGDELEEVRAYYARDHGSDEQTDPEAGLELRNRPASDFDNQPPADSPPVQTTETSAMNASEQSMLAQPLSRSNP